MIKIGNEQNYLNINILFRNFPNSEDYWDANWLSINTKRSRNVKKPARSKKISDFPLAYLATFIATF